MMLSLTFPFLLHRITAQLLNLCSDSAKSKKKTHKQLIEAKDEQDRLQREAEAVC
jgi:hypothetical protein